MPEKTSDVWWLFSRQTVSITIKESVFNSALLMRNRNFRHLPVITESGKILGILSAQDVVDTLNLTLKPSISADELKTALDIPVERVMTGHPVVVEPGDGLREVINKLSHHNVGALPVVNMLGMVEGIITLRDLVSLMGISSSPVNVPVAEIMNTNVITAAPGLPLVDAVRLMSERRVRRLPVVDGEGLKGMLTNKDVLRQVARSSGGGGQAGFERPISEFMASGVINISQDDDIRTAANHMTIFGVGGLVIQDLPSDRIGLITERDLIRTLSSKRGIDFLMSTLQYELEVEDVMSRMRSYTSAGR